MFPTRPAIRPAVRTPPRSRSPSPPRSDQQQRQQHVSSKGRGPQTPSQHSQRHQQPTTPIRGAGWQQLASSQNSRLQQATRNEGGWRNTGTQQGAQSNPVQERQAAKTPSSNSLPGLRHDSTRRSSIKPQTVSDTSKTEPKTRSLWAEAESFEEMEAVLQANIKRLGVYYKDNKDHFHLVPPTHFNIASDTAAGNGFLEKGSESFYKDEDKNRELVNAQWKALVDTLLKSGALVTIDRAELGLWDQVFRADPTLSIHYISRANDGESPRPDVVVLSKFSHPERVKESDAAKRGLSECDTCSETIRENLVEAEYHMEGTGDNLIDNTRGIIISGQGQRNQDGASEELSKRTGLPVHTIETTDPFFHVDTFLAVLPSGHAIYAEDVLTDNGKEQLQQALFKGNEELSEKYSIKVSKELAHAFFCNLVVVNNKTIIVQKPHKDMHFPEGSKSFDEIEKEYQSVVKKLREELGLTVEEADVHTLNLAGGGLHCAVNKINHPVILDLEKKPHRTPAPGEI